MFIIDEDDRRRQDGMRWAWYLCRDLEFSGNVVVMRDVVQVHYGGPGSYGLPPNETGTNYAVLAIHLSPKDRVEATEHVEGRQR